LGEIRGRLLSQKIEIAGFQSHECRFANYLANFCSNYMAH